MEIRLTVNEALIEAHHGGQRHLSSLEGVTSCVALSRRSFL